MAGNQDLVTYLSLTPEFGGTRFGPFEGLEVRLGSDAERCHIVLPASLGVIAEHVKLIRQGPLNLILAPAERTATVFLYRQGERRPAQLNTPTAVRPGDAFTLVTPDGPRFIVEVGELPPEVKAAREAARGPKTGRRRLSADAFKQEGIRQIWTRILTFGPAQMFQRAWVYIQSGAIYQPRNIILFATIASGWVFGGAMGCRSRGFKKNYATTVTRLEDCEENVSLLGGLEGKDISQYSFTDLVAAITRSSFLASALNEDQDLRKRVEKEADRIYFQKERYSWLIGDGNSSQLSTIKKWRKRLESDNSGIDNDTARILTWAIAQPTRNPDVFHKLSDSSGELSCGRGPLDITYRQAVHLGFSSSQPDRFITTKPSGLDEDNAAMAVEIQRTLATFQAAPPLVDGSTFRIEALSPTGSGFCVYQDGDDDRDDINDLARALKDAFSDKRRLPPANANHGSIARLAKLYAADIYNSNYLEKDQGIDFSDEKKPVSFVLTDKELGAAGSWVLDRTAEAIAKSIVLPCIAVLDNKDPAVVKDLVGETPPSDLMCLVLNYKLQSDND